MENFAAWTVASKHFTFRRYDTSYRRWCQRCVCLLMAATMTMSCAWHLFTVEAQFFWVGITDTRQLRSVFFWDLTQCRVVILYGHFGTTYWSLLQAASSWRRILGTLGMQFICGMVWAVIGSQLAWCRPIGLMQWEERKKLVAWCCAEVEQPRKMKPLLSVGRGDWRKNI